jgi:hypothetical protein
VRGNDVLAPEDGKLLRHHRLIEAEDLLEFLNAVLASSQYLENSDANRVRKRAKELGLEDLQVRMPIIHI